MSWNNSGLFRFIYMCTIYGLFIDWLTDWQSISVNSAESSSLSAFLASWVKLHMYHCWITKQRPKDLRFVCLFSVPFGSRGGWSFFFAFNITVHRCSTFYRRRNIIITAAQPWTTHDSLAKIRSNSSMIVHTWTFNQFHTGDKKNHFQKRLPKPV